MTQGDEQLVKETAEKIGDWLDLRDLIYTNFVDINIGKEEEQNNLFMSTWINQNP